MLPGCRPPEHVPPKPAKVPVRSEVLEAGPFAPNLMLLGRIEPAARLEVRSPAAGRVAYPPRFAAGLRTGERVTRGELLLVIDNDETRLQRAEAELAARLAETELTRARQGVEGGFLPAAELKQREIDAELAAERLDAAQRRSTRLRVLAPASGVLRVDRAYAPGSEIARAETPLAELLADGLPRVEAWAAAADRERLRTGLAVEILAPGSDRIVGRGTVTEVAREIDRAGTLRLVAEMTETANGGASTGGAPLPGEGVELRLLLGAKPQAVTVPQEALMVDGGVASVFVLEPSGGQYRARRRLVQAGSWSDGRVEILDGLKPGERVAVRGAEFLADGLPATEVEAPHPDPLPQGEREPEDPAGRPATDD